MSYIPAHTLKSYTLLCGQKQIAEGTGFPTECTKTLKLVNTLGIPCLPIFTVPQGGSLGLVGYSLTFPVQENSAMSTLDFLSVFLVVFLIS